MARPVEWTWREIGDRAQVGALFGTLAGLIALLVALVYGMVARWSGRTTHGSLALHAALILLYLIIGIFIGGFWPRRFDRLGRWSLWLLASTPLSVTILALVRGAPAQWSTQSWLHLAIMIPAFAWVIGDGRRAPNQKERN